jgi:DNA-binding MarR family transcriptional regulator
MAPRPAARPEDAADALRALVQTLRHLDRGRDRETVLGRQRAMLVEIRDAPGASFGELATRLHVDLSSVSVLGAKLAAGGFIVSAADRADRRRRRLTLTARGRAALRGAPSASEALREAIAALPPAQRSALNVALGALRTTLVPVVALALLS